jgi:hypothetical protein
MAAEDDRGMLPEQFCGGSTPASSAGLWVTIFGAASGLASGQHAVKLPKTCRKQTLAEE